MELPSGIFTFLFTDIEGSSKLWEENPEQMSAALARHDALLRSAVENSNGKVFKTIGDAFCAAFDTAADALAAALAGQDALCRETFPDNLPLRVRMALHTGTAEQRDNDYFGQSLNRVARILETGHGGQILLSGAVQDLCRDALPPSVELQNLGEHRLRDLTRPETIFQILHPDLPSEFPPLRSLSSTVVRHNLPQQLTSFIGREKERADLLAMLAETRLLTLTGAGGSGKTRLSLQLAAETLDNYPDGVWQVDLAPLSDPALVVQTAASVLGVQEQKSQPLLQTLQDALRSKTLLLLLDNAEHVVEACAHLTAGLLRTCPNLRILVTSREKLAVEGEKTYPVPSLSLPHPQHDATIESVSRHESVRLFIERARLVKSDFVLTNDNAATVAHICYQLDGIPLALELAAARVRGMAAEQLADRLDDRFRLLTGGSRTALPRQQTLRALIDWSYDLLSETESLLFSRLSVFVGGWTLEAAEAVCAGEGIEDWEILDLMMGLADKSLVIYQEQEESGRYRLLETIRQYALGKLAEFGETAQVKNAHLAYFLQFAETAKTYMTGHAQGEWMTRLETEHDNLRAALAWCATAENGGLSGLRLTAALLKFWDVRGYWHEGSAHYRTALNHPDAAAPTKERAAALVGAGMLARYQSDYQTSRRMSEEVLQIREALGDRAGMAQVLNNIGTIELREGNHTKSKELCEASLAIRRELNDKVGMAACLLNLGTVAQETGHNDDALAHYQESLALFHETGDKGNMTILLTNMGNLALSQQQHAEARRYYEESLALARASEDKFAIGLALVNLAPLLGTLEETGQSRAALVECLGLFQELGEKRLIAYALEAFAQLIAEHSPERAVCLWAATNTLRETIPAPLPFNEQEQLAAVIAHSWAALTEEVSRKIWAEGRTLTMEQAIEYALAEDESG